MRQGFIGNSVELNARASARSIGEHIRDSALTTAATTTTTTTKQRSALAQQPTMQRSALGVQLAFAGCGVESFAAKRRRATTQIDFTSRDGELLEEFARRLSNRHAKKTVDQYMWVLKDVLALAALSGESPSLEKLFTNLDLMGRTLARATDASDSRTISAWLAAQRRSVLRSFAGLMEQELETLGITDPSARITQVLQAIAEPIGSGFRLPVGRPRGRGGPMPSEEDIDAIREAIADRPGWEGTRNTAFLSILNSRGQRIGALLQLDGSNLHRYRMAKCACLSTPRARGSHLSWRCPLRFSINSRLTSMGSTVGHK